MVDKSVVLNVDCMLNSDTMTIVGIVLLSALNRLYSSLHRVLKVFL